MQVFILLLLGSVCIQRGAPDPLPVVKMGVLLPYKGNYPWGLPVTLPALEYAVETIRKDSTILPGYDIQLTTKDSLCSEVYGPLAAFDMMMERSAHVFIGPACDYAVAPVARYSPFWKIPILSAGGMVAAFQNKRQYKLLTRIQASYAKAGEFFVQLCANFNWTKVGLLYHNFGTGATEGRSDCYFTMEAIFIASKQYMGVKPWHTSFDEHDPNLDMTAILKEMSKEIRIVVLCASPTSVREIMLKAEELNFDNGEYVFFNIDLFVSKNQSEVPWYRANDTKERNEQAKKAYQALMTVTLRKPTSPEYHKFSDEVKRRARAKYENFTYGEEEVNSFVGAFHDAVILYALALNETLADNGNITDGAEITRRMWNRTFEGITGTVSIDANGDRNGDYSLLDLNPRSGKFEVVANYYGNKKEYEPVGGKHIYWAGGRTSAPPDTPKCGFDGSLCPPTGGDPPPRELPARTPKTSDVFGGISPLSGGFDRAFDPGWDAIPGRAAEHRNTKQSSASNDNLENPSKAQSVSPVPSSAQSLTPGSTESQRSATAAEESHVHRKPKTDAPTLALEIQILHKAVLLAEKTKLGLEKKKLKLQIKKLSLEIEMLELKKMAP